MSDDDKLGWMDAWADLTLVEGGIRLPTDPRRVDWRMRTEVRGRRTGRAFAQAVTERLWDGQGLHWHRVGPGGLNEGHNCPPECADGKPADWTYRELDPVFRVFQNPETVYDLIRRHRSRQAAIQDLFLLTAVLRSGTFWIQWAWRQGYRGPLRGKARL